MQVCKSEYSFTLVVVVGGGGGGGGSCLEINGWSRP